MQRSEDLIGPGYSFRSLTEKISGVVLTRRTPLAWVAGVAVSLLLLVVFGYSVFKLLVEGVGIWGVNQPVGWGFDITNLVWWIGIAHAGTLISAILLLFRQEWRTSINRFAEAMTLFALVCASLFPILHVGRPWLVYWFFPYPNTFDLWPQFRSPLVWDAFAINTYALVSLLFWLVGLLPDLAVLRDRAENRWLRYLYGFAALGWRGDAGHWQRWESANRLLAGLATALVVLVSSVVSLDFATGVIPGWRSTIFPPYFVAGGIFCGLAMVLVLLIPLRKIYRFEDFITLTHLDHMAKVLLATGLFVAYGYLTEGFTAWYSGSDMERYWLFNRSFGPYAWAFWGIMFCNVVAPQALWSPWVRRQPLWLFLVALLVNIGMWLERYTIIVVALHRDFLPSSWGMYAGTLWDWTIFVGSIGLFLLLILLFIRVLPMIAITEMSHLLAAEQKARGVKALADQQAPPKPIRVAAIDPDAPFHGLLAEFDSPDALLQKTRATYAAGYRNISAHSPFPIAGLPAALGLRPSRLPLVVLVGGIVGAVVGFGMQYYAAVIDYPWNIGGRPLNSWPSFSILTLELIILFAAGSAVLGMVLRNGFPQLYHALFNAPRFGLASQERFFLCIEANDPKFDGEGTREFLEKLGPVAVSGVEK